MPLSMISSSEEGVAIGNETLQAQYFSLLLLVTCVFYAECKCKCKEHPQKKDEHSQRAGDRIQHFIILAPPLFLRLISIILILAHTKLLQDTTNSRQSIIQNNIHTT